MSIEQIKKEIKALGAEEQAKLIAYLAYLRQERDPAYKRLLAQWRDDRDPSHWLTPDEAEKRLAQP